MIRRVFAAVAVACVVFAACLTLGLDAFAAEPDTAMPQGVAPDTAKPDAVAPDVAKPEAVAPETLKPPEPLVHIAVADAPGDGETALAAALAKRLAALGVKEGSPHSAEIYLIEGVVETSPASRGRQSVRVDWRVYGPDGGTLGGVSQTKLVRKGSLDRTWGAAADAAARAAVGGIVKLIPR